MIERRSRRTEGGATWIWGVTMSLAPEIRVEQVGEGASRVDGDLLAPVSPTALHREQAPFSIVYSPSPVSVSVQIHMEAVDARRPMRSPCFNASPPACS